MTDDLLTGARHRELTEFDEPPSDPVALLGRWLQYRRLDDGTWSAQRLQP